MTQPNVVGHEEWLKARMAFLAREKEFTRLREDLARERRQLPWERVDKPYLFEGPEGRLTLADLFGKHDQLIVYHFMFGPDWEEGCPGCSYWADNFNGVDGHLAARDTALVAISRAPHDKLETYKKRMGWNFRWVSAVGPEFNHDFGVTRRSHDKVMPYNYGSTPREMEEMPGLSTFIRQDGNVFHTYSTYARGLDVVNGAHHLLDLTAKGRREEELSFPMAWVRRHDQY
jgi:predicted dithiol-disulfide oxidoreductase (DUF899 family)